MATYGDDLERRLGDVPHVGAHRRSTGEPPRIPPAGHELPAPVTPPPALPTATPLPAPDRSAVPISSLASPIPAGSAAPPNSYTDIRAVHEATTQQLRERRATGVNGASGRSVAVACAVVVLGGIAVVLGAVLI